MKKFYDQFEKRYLIQSETIRTGCKFDMNEVASDAMGLFFCDEKSDIQDGNSETIPEWTGIAMTFVWQN